MCASSGVFAIAKPANITSAAALEMVKRSLRKIPSVMVGPSRLRVGHGGTLDKPAEGVLVIGVNDGCKALAHYLQHCTKRYAVRACLGAATDTLDQTGAVTARRPFSHVSREALDSALAALVPGYLQEAPLFSALKVGGVRMSDVARAGGSGAAALQPKVRHVDIYGTTLGAFDPPYFSFSVQCGSGTYVRSIVRDVARGFGPVFEARQCGNVKTAVGTVAHMTHLHRTEQGVFTIAEAIREEDWTPEAFHQALDKYNRDAAHLIGN